MPEALGVKREQMPHAATYRRVLGSGLDINEVEREMGLFLSGCGVTYKALAMDGKSLRGAIPGGETRGVYLLAVYAPKSGVVLRQVEIGAKENELSVARKDNQPSLRADIARLFAPEHVPLGSGTLKTDFQSTTTYHKLSGRL